jgi:MarR family transcriptional regulator for hemolysin
MRDQLPFALARVFRRWRKLLDERLKDLGVTQARWTTMVYLHKSGEGLTQRDLASRMAIENPTLVRLLDNLESQGLVERRACEEDRRARRLFLTSRGTEFMDVLYQRSEDLRNDLLEGVSEKDLKATLKVMDRVLSNAERLL